MATRNGDAGQRVAIVVGASGGIGRATVAALTETNWQIIACNRRHDDSGQTRGLNTRHVIESVELDLENDYSVRQAALVMGQSIDQADAIINCAGDIHMAPADELAPALWNRLINANLTGVYHLAHFVMPLLRETGSFVVIGAQSERLRLPGMSAYVAAKAGLEAFMAALAKEQRSRKIALLRPGAVATPFWDRVPLRLPKSALDSATVAAKILQIIDQGESGVVDL